MCIYSLFLNWESLNMRRVRWFVGQVWLGAERPVGAGSQVCVVRLTNSWKHKRGLGVSHNNWDSVSFGHLLTDRGGGRRALELEAWEQLGGPLLGPCPGTEVWVWPRAEISVKGVACPIMGPGARFGPGQGWEPCCVWVKNRDPIEGKSREDWKRTWGTEEWKGPRYKKKQVRKETEVKQKQLRGDGKQTERHVTRMKLAEVLVCSPGWRWGSQSCGCPGSGRSGWTERVPGCWCETAPPPCHKWPESKGSGTGRWT